MGNTPVAEHTITIDLVRALLTEQAPSLADLPVVPYAGGWDNELFRLGETLLVRLPRREVGARLMEHELAWVPRIAPHLPVEAPTPIFTGKPGQGYPWAWSIVPLIRGRRAADVPVGERIALSDSLADVCHALHTTAPEDAPLNPYRGGTLNRPEADERFRARVAAVRGAVDADALLARWDAWRVTPDWDAPDVWVHGDLHPLNLLVDDAGDLAGVVDWGDMTAGDPAVDLATAWLTLDAAGRDRFVARAGLSATYDADTWARARAWALHLALAFLASSDDAPALRAISEHALAQLLAEPVA